MARVTVEDCEKVVHSRFDLVLLAAQRARQILAGNPVLVEQSDEKKTVVALREIASSKVDVEALENELINSLRTCTAWDNDEDNIEDDVEGDDYNPTVMQALDMTSLEASSNGVSIVDDLDDNKDEDIED